MIDLRLTSLCNVIYNMFAKILVNRIKPVSNSFIGDAQSVFVSNRLITDNILIAIELFHWLIWRRRAHTHDTFSIKIDTSKAYDRV